MKKRLIFPEPDYGGQPKDNYIILKKDMVYDYNGIYPLKPFGQDSNKGLLRIDDEYEVVKLKGRQKDVYGVDATHEIICETLNNEVHNPAFIKLTPFEEFYICWYHKRTIIQSLDVKKTVITGAIGVIIGAVIDRIIGC